jgi:class 3 adenylate cyclase
VFDGPARAIRCARAIIAATAAQGLSLKVGVHTGECDFAAGVAQGLAARISGRIARLARAGEVLVSRTVVDLVAGSRLHFSDRGAHDVAEGTYKWHLFAVVPDMRDNDGVSPASPQDHAACELAHVG